MKTNWPTSMLTISAPLMIMALAGCSSNVNKVMHTKTTMKDIVGSSHYQDSARNRPAFVRPVNSSLVDYTRDAMNETDALFKELPNPRLVMYVHPHLTPDGTPIPGYSVPLYFYSEVQYAMPGELYGWE